MLNKSEAPLFGYWFWAAKAYFHSEFLSFDKTAYHWNRIGKVNICQLSEVIHTIEMGWKRFFLKQMKLIWIIVRIMKGNFVGNKKWTSDYHKWTKKHNVISMTY